MSTPETSSAPTSPDNRPDTHNEPEPALEEDVAVDRRDEVGEQMIRDLPRQNGPDPEPDPQADVNPEPKGGDA